MSPLLLADLELLIAAFGCHTLCTFDSQLIPQVLIKIIYPQPESKTVYYAFTYA